jgi:arylsulfate sulfotransferase
VKNSRIGMGLIICGLCTLSSLGCGFNSTTPPSLATVSPTSHPLVAQYTLNHVRQGLSAWVEFGPDTNYGQQTSTIASTSPNRFGETINILVAGMRPQSTYHMRAHLDGPAGSWTDQDRTFTTGTLPTSQIPTAASISQVPGITVTRPDPSLAPAPGVELLSLTSITGANILSQLVTDTQGNVIWYCPISSITTKLLQNGHFIVNHTTDLQEVDLACNVVRDVSVAQVNQSLQANGYDFTIASGDLVPGGSPLHHDMLVLPNGHWIALCQVAKNFTDLPGYSGTTLVVGDALVDIDPNGNVVWGWSSFDHLDVNRHPYFGLPDWTHSNAIVYTADGNLLLSMRAQSWVLKIDYANGTGSGNILWKLGPEGDFTLLGGDPSQWFYAQHYPNILSTNGSQMTLAIYDDGNFRTDLAGVACESNSTAPACYSRATIFQLDESTSVASLLWQYLPGFYSFWGGSIGELSNGDIEFDSSEPFYPATPVSSQIIEVTQTNNPQMVWQMTITGANAYRGYRMPSLYPGVTWQQ